MFYLSRKDQQICKFDMNESKEINYDDAAIIMSPVGRGSKNDSYIQVDSQPSNSSDKKKLLN